MLYYLIETTFISSFFISLHILSLVILSVSHQPQTHYHLLHHNHHHRLKIEMECKRKCPFNFPNSENYGEENIWEWLMENCFENIIQVSNQHWSDNPHILCDAVVQSEFYLRGCHLSRKHSKMCVTKCVVMQTNAISSCYPEVCLEFFSALSESFSCRSMRGKRMKRS